MTQYLLTVFHPEITEMPPMDEMQAMIAAVGAVNTELQETGAWVFAGGLTPPSSATSVRVKDGDLLTTDGPFTETKEQMGGFWIIEAADLDVALEWATKATKACGHPIEVRAFQG